MEEDVLLPLLLSLRRPLQPQTRLSLQRFHLAIHHAHLPPPFLKRLDLDLFGDGELGLRHHSLLPVEPVHATLTQFRDAQPCVTISARNEARCEILLKWI